MSTPAYIKSGDHLTVVFADGETVTVYESNARYKDIIVALNAKDFDLVKRLASPVAAIKSRIAAVAKRGINSVDLRDGVVYYNGEALHNTLTNRIIGMANEGFDIEPMCKFLANLQNNPSYRAVNELYGFLEKGNLPITEDGYFLAYKKVRDDYTDVHTGKFDNSVGQVVVMPRNQVNENPNETCSAGLHFCSRDYLSQFSGERVMILKINPADVVAIPVDYNQTKGRTCQYEVIGELGVDEKLEGDFKPSEKYVPPVEYTEPVYAAIDEAGEVEMEFTFLESAAEWAGTTPSAIRRVLKGNRKTTAGYGWKLIKGTEAHAKHLANDHNHGTLNQGRPHFDEDDDDFTDEDFDDDDFDDYEY